MGCSQTVPRGKDRPHLTPEEGEWQWVTVPWPPLRLEAQEGAIRLRHGAPASPLAAGARTRGERELRQQHGGHGLVSGLGCGGLGPSPHPELADAAGGGVSTGCVQWLCRTPTGCVSPLLLGAHCDGAQTFPRTKGSPPSWGRSPAAEPPVQPQASLPLLPTPYPRCPARRSGNLASCPRLPPWWCALPPRHV